jgi:hypothetical protein
MTLLVPFETITTVRDGKRLVVPPGAAFDFAADEAEHLLSTGIARLANNADQSSNPEPALVGSAVLAATRKKTVDPAEVGREIGAGIAEALAAKDGKTAAKTPKGAPKPAASSDDDL